MINSEIQINDSIDAFGTDRYTRLLVAREALTDETPIRPTRTTKLGI
jgi:hypothetical protein